MLPDVVVLAQSGPAEYALGVAGGLVSLVCILLLMLIIDCLEAP